MPDPRPRPRDSKPVPRRNRPRAAPKKINRPRTPQKGPDHAVLYWVAGALVLLLIAVVVLYFETPEVKAWLAGSGQSSLPEKPASLPESTAEIPPPTQAPPLPAPVTPVQPKTEQHVQTLKEKADAETQKLVEHPTAKPVVPSPAPVTPPFSVPNGPSNLTPTPTNNFFPPVVQPINAATGKGVPARALPLDPNKLDTERIAAYQVALERIHFSCGFIDGDQGMRTQRMLRAYQQSRGLPVTGILDQATRHSIGEPGEPFLNYVVTQADVDSIMPKPKTWREKSQAKYLGYNDIWELLAEKFHCARIYLKQLNPTVKTPVVGTEMIGPKVFPAAPIPHAASLRIYLSETEIEALDANGKIIAFFPCSIAKDKNKRPSGLLTVKVVDPNPDYTFDPALFADAAKAEGITHKMMIPPGPRNPVGTAWVGLSLPGYGIHGTPEPENISRTQSHGCFRLANWNADKVLKMVRVGTPVDVEP